METPRTPDPSGPTFNPKQSPNTLGGGSSGERFTVQDVERQIRSRSRRRDYTTTRSRREARMEVSPLDRYVWLGVAAIAVVYVGFLGFSMLRSRSAAPSAPPEPPVEAAVATAPATTDEAVAAPAAEDAVAEQGIANPPESILPLEETVKSIKRAEILHLEAVRLARDQRYGEADDKFTAAAAITPARFKLLFDWAESLRAQKRWAAARDLYLQAVAVQPESVESRLALAQCCFQLRQMADALALATWVLEAEPYSESAHQVAADVLVGMERYETAIKHLQKLVALNSGNHIAANNLGAVQFRLGQYAQAISTFDSVIRDEPGNSQAYYQLALVYLARNNPEMAVDVLVRASGQFGRDFVLAWTRGPEFASLQDVPMFRQHFGAAP